MICKEIRLLFNDSLAGIAKSMTIQNEKNIIFTFARFDKEKIKEIFSRGFFHVAAQKYPFQMEIEKEDGTIIKIPNIWIIETRFVYQADNWIIVEDMKVEAEKLPEELFKKL